MKFIRMLGTLAVLLAFGFGSASAFAQSTRTWVSGVGDDANPCSRTAPCKTFAGAISKTAAGGEINCSDSGGFGVLTITKAISIICSAGEAGVLANGSDGIAINAGPSDVVHLSGLDIEGLGTGLSGVNIIQAGQVRIEKSTIRGFTTAGVYVAPSAASGHVAVDVIDSVIADNVGSGIRNKPSGSASVAMLVDRTTVSHNMSDGIMANGTLTTGTLNVIVHDSASVFNGQCGFISYSNGASTRLTVDESSSLENATGVLASGAGAMVLFSRLIISGNGTGVAQTSPGVALSYGNNSIAGNGITGSFGIALALQ